MSIRDEGKFKLYQDLLCDPEWLGSTQIKMAEFIGVNDVTISRWKQDIDWDEVNDRRRQKYGSINRDIDNALIKKARSGDMKAIEMYLQIFQGWIPASKRVNVNEAQTDDELKAEAKRIKEELLKPGNDIIPSSVVNQDTITNNGVKGNA